MFVRLPLVIMAFGHIAFVPNDTLSIVPPSISTVVNVPAAALLAPIVVPSIEPPLISTVLKLALV